MSDVIIIGAGPAGLSASISCARFGLKVLVIDEFMKPGGRLLGQLHQEPTGEWWNGIKESKRLHEEAESLSVHIRCGVSVYNLDRDENNWFVHTNIGTLEAPFVLLATGAAEYSIPLPGWTLPGVMSIGAAQVMTNVHRVQVGKKGIIIGANILSFAILSELQLAGITVDHIVLPEKSELSQKAGEPEEVLNSLLNAAHLAPSAILRIGSHFMKYDWVRKAGLTFYPNSGMKINGTPLHLRKAALEIIGTDQVEGVRVANIDSKGNVINGSEKIYEADFVCIAGGLYPLAELAAVAGCPFHYISELGGHVPLHSETMETPLPGLFVAGNITGIESGKIAMAQGTVAGLSIAKYASKKRDIVDQQLSHAIQNVHFVRQKSAIQFNPMVDIGRRKMNEIWRDYSSTYAHTKKSC
ncbi:TPA: NAD(P)/FAD-dependent oxidoreductase [Bacillus thuringiensis]|uniref:Sarcosine oxidase subunit alpha n=2 Tax=Bacillus cereus group TaxID=86661 RepID=A0A9X6QCE1_BACTU|nr:MULTISPECIES: NAD(P)/FAD-dependent oxidoreductase [Bacillus]WIK93507.1 NAD(P)/FAD-dependent oxidoreductase [Bacillus bombysepticus]AGE78716.1 Sarcosine oxidase alpha subunit [Bacillus thuringiensis serovar kurstaki str. HD73]AHZ51750.1 sarcosine oxidase subunit alpha [Bacillus thuringiensis serovar kurstaki str. YBT-1520]AIE34172.1 sarcosine oxidase subunit alpha [Bacillus thuringiensis serovar kurstaki str. HD-1]AIM31513.1 sarcosine oxidase alpha subunit [Bacillus thuringiensis serovar kur